MVYLFVSIQIEVCPVSRTPDEITEPIVDIQMCVSLAERMMSVMLWYVVACGVGRWYFGFY